MFLTIRAFCAIIASSEQSVRGVRGCARMKREAGANPARTRRCKAGALRQACHWTFVREDGAGP